MKTTSIMKLLAGFSFMGLAILGNAQSTESSAWSVSKDVQRISNKKLFEDESLKASHINAVVLNPTWNLSKGVQSVGRSSDIGKGNVASSNTVPAWTISKGVQRIQQKKSMREPEHEIFKREEEITRNGEGQ